MAIRLLRDRVREMLSPLDLAGPTTRACARPASATDRLTGRVLEWHQTEADGVWKRPSDRRPTRVLAGPNQSREPTTTS